MNTVTAFVEEWFSTIFLGTLVVLLAVVLFRLIGSDISLDRYGKQTCLQMGYPNTTVVYARISSTGNARVFCINQLESIEIIVPSDLIGN